MVVQVIARRQVVAHLFVRVANPSVQQIRALPVVIPIYLVAATMGANIKMNVVVVRNVLVHRQVQQVVRLVLMMLLHLVVGVRELIMRIVVELQMLCINNA